MPGTIFSITEDDIAALNDEEFDDIWGALGRVARARARARSSKPDTPNSAAEEAVGENEEAPGPPSSSNAPGASEGVVQDA